MRQVDFVPRWSGSKHILLDLVSSVINCRRIRRGFGWEIALHPTLLPIVHCIAALLPIIRGTEPKGDMARVLNKGTWFVQPIPITVGPIVLIVIYGNNAIKSIMSLKDQYECLVGDISRSQRSIMYLTVMKAQSWFT